MLGKASWQERVARRRAWKEACVGQGLPIAPRSVCHGGGPSGRQRARAMGRYCRALGSVGAAVDRRRRGAALRGGGRTQGERLGAHMATFRHRGVRQLACRRSELVVGGRRYRRRRCDAVVRYRGVFRAAAVFRARNPVFDVVWRRTDRGQGRPAAEFVGHRSARRVGGDHIVRDAGVHRRIRRQDRHQHPGRRTPGCWSRIR